MSHCSTLLYSFVSSVSDAFLLAEEGSSEVTWLPQYIVTIIYLQYGCNHMVPMHVEALKVGIF